MEGRDRKEGVRHWRHEEGEARRWRLSSEAAGTPTENRQDVLMVEKEDWREGGEMETGNVLRGRKRVPFFRFPAKKSVFSVLLLFIKVQMQLKPWSLSLKMCEKNTVTRILLCNYK